MFGGDGGMVIAFGCLVLAGRRDIRSLRRRRLVCVTEDGGQSAAAASPSSSKSSPSGDRKGKLNPATGSGPLQRQRRLKSQRLKQVWNGEYGRVGCYCTCEEFELDQVTEFLVAEPSAEVVSFDDSVHFRTAERVEESVFVFPYGAVVIWGMDAASEQLVLTHLKDFQLATHERPSSDEFRYLYSDAPGINNEAMSLTRGVDVQETLRERLALSHALAQSVKLATFEESVQATIAATRHLPAELAMKGKISASRKDVSKNVGRLFVDRHNVYLYADVLDTPDYFWDYETHEWLYLVAARYLELTHRAEWLFRRLEMVRELYDLLGQELQFKHTSDLEMVIIGLITFEILLTLAKDWANIEATGSLVGMQTTNVIILILLTISLGIVIGIYVHKTWQKYRHRNLRTLPAPSPKPT